MNVLALALAIAQPAASPYQAHGTEPFWGVRIGDGRIVYTSAEGARIAVRTPRRRPIRNGYRYVTPRMRIDVTQVRCGDGMGDRLYADTFRISFPGRIRMNRDSKCCTTFRRKRPTAERRLCIRNIA